MDLIRIGDKVIDRDRIYSIIDRVLTLRSSGLSQTDVANELGIDRTFVSRLESIGELRKGKKIAIVGFPVKNKDELIKLASDYAVDHAFILNNEERWEFIKSRNGVDLFNDVLGLIYKLRNYDRIIFIGSDMRIKMITSILGDRIIGIEIGKSPIKEDVHIDPELIEKLLKEIREEDTDSQR